MKKDSALGLLELLKKEKQRLIDSKEILNKKDDHVYPIIDTPFNIPANWAWCYLSDVSLIQEGPGIRKHQYSDDGVQFLTVTNILEGDVDLEKSQKFISLEQYKNYSHFTINKGDIVTACSGGSWGKSAIYNLDKKIILNTSTLRLRFFGDLGDNKYLYYLTKTKYFKSSLSLYTTGQQPNYGYYHYSRIPIPLPPFPEQQRIVSVLDEAFASIAQAKSNAERNLVNARELFETISHDIFSNPHKDWQEKKLGDLCEKITKGSSPKWQGIKYVDEPGILFITSENVGMNEIILDKRKYVEEKFNVSDKKSILQKGDVLTNIVGASIGRTAIFNLDDLANINQAVCILRCKEEVLHNLYLSHLLNSPFFRDILHDNEVDNARANLSLGFFSNLAIPVPPLAEQRAIVGRLEALSAETGRLEDIYWQKVESLEELKKSVLQKAFEGELTGKVAA